MSLKLKSSETASYQSDSMVIAQGITFHLPSRQRFIPYVWLLHAELNQDETELYLHYTHCVVTIVGTGLSTLHEGVASFQLKLVRESLPWALPEKQPTVRRIEITEKISEV